MDRLVDGFRWLLHRPDGLFGFILLGRVVRSHFGSSSCCAVAAVPLSSPRIVIHALVEDVIDGVSSSTIYGWDNFWKHALEVTLTHSIGGLSTMREAHREEQELEQIR